MKVRLKHMTKPIKLIFSTLFVTYVLLLAYLTFFSHYYGRGIVRRSINVLPFNTIFEFLMSGYNINTIITNLIGNIAAFMPMGFLLTIVFKRLNTFLRICTAILFASIFIEVVQFFAGVGASDIDDVILNMLGGIMGYWIYRLFIKLRWFD